MRNTRSCLVVLLGLFHLAALGSLAQPRPVRFGVVIDGPWVRNDEIRAAFEEEITELLGEEFPASFPAESRVTADGTAGRINEALDRMLADPSLDMVIAMGPIASNEASRREIRSKPVIAPFVIDPGVQGIPLSGGASGADNLSYVVIGGQARREVEMFRELVPFDRLVVLVGRGLTERIPELRTNMEETLEELGVQVEVISVGTSVESALAAIPEDAEAVYVAPLHLLADGEFERLVQGLIDRRLPSFSMWGRSEVERGILAGLGLDLDYRRLARRVALNIQRILLGEPAASLPVAFTRRERLTINMATARAVNTYPNWALITEAELLHDERTNLTRQVSLESAVREAENVNLDLAAADRTVSAGEYRIRRAQAEMRPQFTVSGVSRVIDADRAEASFGSAGRWTTVGTAALQQRLYSESARAGIDVERHLQTARTEERAQLRLDVVLDAALAYLNVLRAKTVERIQKENLGVTRTHLELARSRQALGASGPEEVYRWENQIANNRRDVIDSIAARNQAEIALNRILNRPLEEPFGTAEASLDDPELRLSFRRLSPYVNNPAAFRIFRDFMTQEAFDSSPELRRIDAGIAAQERTLLVTRRSAYVPEVSAQADISTVGKVGGGTGLSLGGLPAGASFPTPGNVDWNLTLRAAVPIFTGGARRAEVLRIEEELAKQHTDREALAQRIEQRTRSHLHSAGASFAGIELAADAARAARQNLGLVSDAYSRGLMSIIQLVDAQNAALVADLLAANATFDFLVDLMNAERAIGRFDFFVNAADEQALFERMNAYYQKEGYPVTRP